MARQIICSMAIALAWMVTPLAQRAAAPRPRAQDQPKVQDLTVTGCVIEGTDAGVYVLTNALTRPDVQEVPKTFRLVSGGEDLDFALHSNHQVQAIGRAEVSAPPREAPPGGRIDPRDLPAFSVKSMRSISDRCVAGD